MADTTPGAPLDPLRPRDHTPLDPLRPGDHTPTGDEPPRDADSAEPGVPVVITRAAGAPRPAFPGEPAADAPPARRDGWIRMLAVALIGGVVGAALAAGAVWWLLEQDSGDADPAAVTVVERVETQVVAPGADVTTATAVARAVLPSIVTVEVSDGTGTGFVADGSGSGVVLEANGLLVTNEHVVAGAQEVRVVFADGRIYQAEVIGADALTDVALLRIEATGLVPVELGTASGLEIGDTAIAVGSPLGLGGGPSVTVGVVSAFERRVRTGIDEELYGMLQTDAPITRGSSGGALVDDRGRLIGITTAIGISDVGAEGLGFAIPIEMVNRIVEDLRDDGAVEHAFLGITGVTYFEEQPDGSQMPAGAVIGSVEPGSAAEEAGLEPGDVILSFDGTDLVTMEQLVVGIRLYRVGDTTDVDILRDGARRTVTVTLKERPEGL